MKRILVLMLSLAVLLATASPVSAGVAVSGVTSVTLEADPAFTSTVKEENTVWIARLLELLDSASALSAKPVNSLELVTMTLHPAGSACTVLADGERCFVLYGGVYYKVDSEDLYALLADVKGLYRFRSIPQATVQGTDGAQTLAPASGTYIYHRLDGKYYRINYKKQEDLPVVKSAGRNAVLPEFSLPPHAAEARISENNDREVFRGTLASASTYALQAGKTYLVELTATFYSDHYQGDLVYTYSLLTQETGGVTFSVEGSGTVPGEAVVLRANGIADGAAVTFRSDIPFTPKFFPDGNGGRVALLPVSYFVAPGEHYVELSAGGVTERYAVSVSNKEFQVQNLTVDAQTTEATINSQKANDEYERIIAPLRPVADNTKYWQGRFAMPVTGGRISTQFGAIRYTNGSTAASRHGAMDIALPVGTPVYASNNGRVLYAGYLQLTGNTLLIEHGYGLKTWYYHMNSLAVSTGELVEKGKKVGEVGSTGFSTGPHLHFGMSVNNVFINPATAIETDLLNFG